MNYHPHVFVHMCYRTFHPIEEFIFVHLYGHFSKNIAHKISSFVFTLSVLIINARWNL